MGSSRKFFNDEHNYKSHKKLEHERYYNRVKAIKRGRYSTQEDNIIKTFQGNDLDLALTLGRSIKSVQDRRRRLRKKGLLSET